MEVDDSEEFSKGDTMTVLRNSMIEHLLQNKEIVFKSQQIGEPDLTPAEKRNILEECLQKPLSFLSRFNQYMEKSHFEYLQHVHPEFQYEITHYLHENFSRKPNTVIKNRRLEALKRLALQSDYFTEEEMRKRNPLLYEHLVGKYLTEEEKKEKNSFANTMQAEDGCTLSALLMEQNDRVRAADFQKEQEDAEEEIELDTDDDTNGEQDLSDLEEKDDRVLHLWGESDSTSNYIKTSKRIADAEKKLLYEEFRSHMYRDFIGGKETDFDYSKVDMNTDYDDLEELDRDAQDKYFTSDSPEDEVMELSETGNTNVIEKEITDQGETVDQNSHTENDDPLETFMAELIEEQNHQEINSKLKNTVL